MKNRVTARQVDVVRLRAAATERGLDPDRIEALARTAPPLWAANKVDSQLDDLALILRPLVPGEVRVRVLAPVDDSMLWQVGVVAADRLGLLAITAAMMSHNHLTVVEARVATWPTGVALQQLTVLADQPGAGPAAKSGSEPDWTTIGQALRHSLETASPSPGPGAFSEAWIRTATEIAPASNDSGANGQQGKTMLVVVDTADAPGVLAAIAYAFSAMGANVVEAQIHTVGGQAQDVFVVDVPAPSIPRFEAMITARTAPDAPDA